MDGAMKSRSQKIIKAAALGSVSYGILHFMWGPMDAKVLRKYVNEAFFASYGAGTPVDGATQP